MNKNSRLLKLNLENLTWERGTPVSIDKRDIEYDERRCLTSVFNVDELSVGNEASNAAASITSNKP
jgi:hypothetical protein